MSGVDGSAVTRPAHGRPVNGRVSTAERVAEALAKTPDASAAQIAARLGYSERTVQRYQRHVMERVAVEER